MSDTGKMLLLVFSSSSFLQFNVPDHPAAIHIQKQKEMNKGFLKKKRIRKALVERVLIIMPRGKVASLVVEKKRRKRNKIYKISLTKKTHKKYEI